MPDSIINTDIFINQYFASIQSPILVKIMIVITNIASPVGMTILAIVFISALTYKRRIYDSILVAFSMFFGLISYSLIKLLIERPRPENAIIHMNDYSFPSGHSTMSIIFFLLLITIFKDEIRSKIWKAIFIFLCAILFLLIGFSRIYLGEHWLSDVLGGYILGIFWIIISSVAINKIAHKNGV